jgi:hypothetical protein
LTDDPVTVGKQHHAGGGDVALIPTPQEQQRAEEQRQRAAEAEAARAHRDADAAYKDRQLTLTEAANRLSHRNLVFTSILALFTIIGTAAAWYQGYIATKNAHSAEVAAQAAKSAADTAVSALQESQRQFRDTVGQMVAQTGAQQSAAKASGDAAKTAQDTLAATAKQFKIDERPYLVKNIVDLTEKPALNSRLSAEICWKNTGKTPVLNGSMWLYIDVLPTEPTSPTEWIKEARASNSSRIEIGAGLDRCVPIGGANPLGEPWNSQIIAGSAYVYVWGAFVYQDVFKDWHYSTVCAKYNPSINYHSLFLWACSDPDKNEID